MDLFLFHLSTYYEYLFLYAYDDSLGKDQKSKLAIRKIRFIINSRRTHCIRYSNTKGAARWKRQKKIVRMLRTLTSRIRKAAALGCSGNDTGTTCCLCISGRANKENQGTV